MKRLLFILMSIGVCAYAHAHEGDHGPGSVPPQKGGVMRALETVNLELVYQDKLVKIYPFETKVDPKSPSKLDPSDPKKYPVSATLELPKGGPRPLALRVEGDHWLAQVDPKGAHRFTVVLAIEQGGHSDKIKWTVEPKK